MKVEIIDYEPQYKDYFRDLNLEWIEKYFKVEPMDITVLNNPESYILANHGWILFAKYDGQIVGTCALIKHDETTVELGKMAVKAGLQGKGIGTKLGQAVLNKAKAMGYQKIILDSNTILKPALQLYTNLGFVEVPLSHTEYVRSNIQMEKIL